MFIVVSNAYLKAEELKMLKFFAGVGGRDKERIFIAGADT